MKTSDRVLAQRYSRALFEAAQGAGRLGEMQQELAQSYGKVHGQMSWFLHPLIPLSEKTKRLHSVLGPGASSLILKFLETLMDKKRFGLLAAILSDFDDILDEKMGVVKAQVRTALPLTPEEEKRLQEKLRILTGKKVALETREDPEMIGGIWVKVGDWVLDRSFTNILSRMKEKLLQETR
ncbi:MAG: ATP synthase F1 subunit delta [Elusimicrobia bacterium]|nr:ATP synthase F1 subunit delta [Elusimicrobiota bacterium]